MSTPLRTSLMLPVEHAAGEDIAARFAGMLEVARLAEQGGIDMLTAPQHYLAAPSQYLHCVPVLARVAAEATRVALCTNIIQLTLHHPVEVAETLATLDIVCGGRLIAGFGRGYHEREFASFGVPPGKRLSRFLEALRLIERLWTEQRVSHAGEHFSLDDVSLGIRPLQHPRPPIILGASADAMIARCARLADGLSLAGHSTLDGQKRQVAIYRDALAAAGKAFPPPYFRVGVECYVAQTRERAMREALPYVAKKYANYAGWGQDEVLPEEQSFALAPEELAHGRFIIGDAAYVTERMLEYREALGMTVFGLRMHWVGMPHALNMHSLGLFCDKVLPALRSG
jgi:alkanesulfonate monooxygenase SsuD/methylene tetrahydromethanopterin reductase-like flavin-dependent oxidoreductase (luciferase family)